MACTLQRYISEITKTSSILSRDKEVYSTRHAPTDNAIVVSSRSMEDQDSDKHVFCD